MHIELKLQRNRSIFICLIATLAGVGVLLVHSASVTSWPSHFERIYLSRHLIFLAVGLAAVLVASKLSTEFWKKWAVALFYITLALLVLVLIPGIGHRVNGAQRWLRFGPVSFQPSELGKIAIPLFLASKFCHRDNVSISQRRLRFFCTTLLPLLAMFLLVFLQPDLGAVLFLILSSGLCLFLCGVSVRNLALPALAFAPLGAMTFLLKPYQLKRIEGFLASWSDWQNAPYQVKQSLLSLGEGGLAGSGLGRGIQKLSFLPEANTDFVFSVLGEEMGLLGTLGVLFLWIAVFLFGLKLIAQKPHRSFASVLSTTLLCQIVFQAFLNMAVVTALVPPKGIPHPFLSYGGSHLVVTFLAVGAILSLTRNETQTSTISHPNFQVARENLKSNAAF